ncbi:DNA-binding MarR family transcriptional regulator [Litorimonas taeanensis]|uniref:DNA-binding MarR family transcriptional regulator n=1 Tax=Litorimonas taeanensis TaxID=568099 RepID=A0A420WFC0_9PROT|nr:MarR family winged helix-turn-helix transcriptional regulator [Litorimonas taeanensis]RKQ69687.1 DNA-binding MarR family transcriptional regulator [Litorimonas taeanensis]
MDIVAPPHIELSTFWPYQVAVLADQISRHTLSVAKTKAGLNLSQWRVLAAVAEKSGRSAAEVTAITPMDKTIVSRAVSSLITLEMIVKTADTEDKRRSRLDTTDKGQSVYTDIAGHLNRTMIELFDTGPMPEKFIQTLERYSAQMTELIPNGG